MTPTRPATATAAAVSDPASADPASADPDSADPHSPERGSPVSASRCLHAFPADPTPRRRFLELGSVALAAPLAACATDPSVRATRTGTPGSTTSTATGPITNWSAVALSRAIQSRQVSCVEVMTAYLAQIDRLNPTYNAIVSLQPRESLLAQAAERDRELATARTSGKPVGWMHGFPQAPKDMTATAGIVTTQGSPILRNFVPKTDSVQVERIRKAGAILIGKTNTPEFGLGSHTYNTVFGTTVNAYDPTRSAGGSSGGTAVALALNLLPVADGSDYMGSLRNPGAWNNVFGLRPSSGRVPFGPNPEVYVQQLGYEGPMGRSVADLAMLLSVQAGYDARMPLSLTGDPAQFAQPLDKDVKGLRIGWLGDFEGYLPMEDGVLTTCTAALKHFETIGCTVEAARTDFSMERLWKSFLVIRWSVVAGGAGGLYADPKLRAQLKPEAIWEIENGLKQSATDLYKASADRTAWYLSMQQLFQRYDVLVLPTAQIFPFDAKLDWPKTVAGRTMDTYHRWMEVVIAGTMGGGPVLNVPAGFGPRGLPMGLQLIGRPQGELQLLQLGHAYEQASRFTARRSPALSA